MNRITDKEIQDLVNNQYEYLKNIYGIDRMLGVFVYGKATYGFAETMDDIETVMCYLPTFEELCSNRPETKFIEYNNKTIRITDIRLILKSFLTQTGIAMEATFSQWYRIHPKYEKIFYERIYNNKEIIFRTNQKLRIAEAISQARKELLDYKQNGNLESLFQACRRRMSANQYINGTSVENCLLLKQDYFVNYLWGVKNGKITPDLNEIEQDFIDMEERAESLHSFQQGDKIIREAIAEIMRLSFTTSIQGDEFIQLLTSTEKIALKALLKELKNTEGNISISQLINDSGVSRPVFKSVMEKMKENEIAEISNMGVKGTFIQLYDNTLLDLL